MQNQILRDQRSRNIEGNVTHETLVWDAERMPRGYEYLDKHNTEFETPPIARFRLVFEMHPEIIGGKAQEQYWAVWDSHPHPTKGNFKDESYSFERCKLLIKKYLHRYKRASVYMSMDDIPWEATTDYKILVYCENHNCKTATAAFGFRPSNGGSDLKVALNKVMKIPKDSWYWEKKF